MSSILQIEANRANGKKSKGPITVDGKLKALANSAHSTGPVSPEGKARSSQNAVRHGILAESIVLRRESNEAFEQILSALEAELCPETGIERRCVESMAVAQWLRDRSLCLEKELLEIEVDRQEKAAGDNLIDSGDTPLADAAPADNPAADNAVAENIVTTEVNPLRIIALAFRAIIEQSRAPELLNRYENRHDRRYHRALAAFHAHRAARLKAESIAHRRKNAAKAREERKKQRHARKSEKTPVPNELKHL